jgi:SAM-dependent methyltransferase
MTMDEAAYRLYDLESQNWLHRGRRSLLERLLREATTGARRSRLLDVGAGVGQNVPTLARFGDVDAAEIDGHGISRLRQLSSLARLYRDPIPFHLEGKYDVICALDVIEHLEHDRAAIEWMASGLSDGGHIIASVPAYQWLFSEHDRALGHFRRYTKAQFLRLVPPNLEVIRAGYFMSTLLPVAIGSRMVRGVASQVVGAGTTPRKQSSMVPSRVDALLYRVLELEARLFVRGPRIPFGLSVIVLAKRRA